MHQTHILLCYYTLKNKIHSWVNEGHRVKSIKTIKTLNISSFMEDYDDMCFHWIYVSSSFITSDLSAFSFSSISLGICAQVVHQFFWCSALFWLFGSITALWYKYHFVVFMIPWLILGGNMLSNFFQLVLEMYMLQVAQGWKRKML